MMISKPIGWSDEQVRSIAESLVRSAQKENGLIPLRDIQIL